MKGSINGKWKILIIFSVLFLTICLLLLLIFNEGKKSYTVTFDLDGGIRLSGSLEQRVVQGEDAVPPSVTKDGAYLRGWSGSYKKVTKNIELTAIWEYETTAGIIYADSENQNFTEIVGSYPYLTGEVYLGAYYDNKKILGIGEEAFINRTGITKIYLLNGLISIGKSAFEGCTALAEITIPETVTHVKEGAFRGCNALETVTLNEGLLKIESGAFADCEGLTEIIIPETVAHIEKNAFDGCEDLVIKVYIAEEDSPEGWEENWFGNAKVEWEYEGEEETDDSGENAENDNSQKPGGGK